MNWLRACPCWNGLLTTIKNLELHWKLSQINHKKDSSLWKDLVELIWLTKERASLVAQWLGVCLPVQGTRVQALVWEDPTCRGAARPVGHNYWACASGACARQREAAIVGGPRTAMKSGPRTAMRSGPRLPQLEKALTQKRRPNKAIHTYIHKKNVSRQE